MLKGLIFISKPSKTLISVLFKDLFGKVCNVNFVLAFYKNMIPHRKLKFKKK